MVRGSVVVTALVLGVSTLSGCAAGVAGKGDAPASGWAEDAGLGLELSFAEPADLSPWPAEPDLIREPASSADLAIRPDFDPMIDAAPLGQEATEVAIGTDGEGREVATSFFDDSLMTDDGVLPATSGEDATDLP